MEKIGIREILFDTDELKNSLVTLFRWESNFITWKVIFFRLVDVLKYFKLLSA